MSAFQPLLLLQNALWNMDIVYPLLRTDDQNIEFRYSLRSLSNIKFENIFIIWGYPRRLTNVIHIPYKDNDTRYQNVVAKMRIACEDPRISEDFIRMMDDVYILKQIKKIWYYKIWTIKDHLENIKQTFSNANMMPYYRAINWAYERFPKWDDFDTHCPIVFNKTKLLAVLDKYYWNPIAKRTAYCNENNIKWEFLEVPEYKFKENSKLRDCKCYSIDKLSVVWNQLFMSSDNSIARLPEFEEFINNRFPQPSPYELLSYIYLPMEKVKVKLLKSLYPYRKGDEIEMKNEVAEKRERKWFLEVLQKDNKKEQKSERKVEEKKSDDEVVLDKVEKKTTTKAMKKPVANKSMAKRKYTKRK